MRQHLSWQKMETRFCVVCGLKEERVLLVFDCLLTSETPSAAAAFRRWDTCSAKPPWRARTPILILHFVVVVVVVVVVTLRQPGWVMPALAFWTIFYPHLPSVGHKKKKNQVLFRELFQSEILHRARLPTQELDRRRGRRRSGISGIDARCGVGMVAPQRVERGW